MRTPDEVAAMLRLSALGWGERRIATALGCSRRAVRRYLAAEGRVSYRRPRRLKRLEGLEAWLEERFFRHRGNADVVRQELEREQGVTASLRTVERAVKGLRRSLAAEARATLRFETPPGRQLQIDFGETRVSIGGDVVKLHLFVATLGYSRRTGASPPPPLCNRLPACRIWTFLPVRIFRRWAPRRTSPSRPVTNRFSVGDDVSISHGAHSIRFGISMTRVQLNQYWDQYPGGAWIFANLGGNTVPGTPLGGSMYGFPLLCVCGAAPSYSYTTPSNVTYPFDPYRYWRQNWVDPYIQDNWRITARLTLNLGLRYDWASNPTTVKEPVFVINNLTAPTTTEYSFVTAKHPFTNNPDKMEFRSTHRPRLGPVWGSQDLRSRRLRHIPRASHRAHLCSRQHVVSPKCPALLSFLFPRVSLLCLPVPPKPVYCLVLRHSAECGHVAVRDAVQPQRAARSGTWDGAYGRLQRFLGQPSVLLG